MRDAFGGVFMMRLMLVFIVIFISFTAVSFKYAKSFRVKNEVIDFVEQNQIIDLDLFFNKGNNSNLSNLSVVLSTAGYDVSCTDIGFNDGNIIDKETEKVIGYCYNGIIIKKNEQKSTDDTIYYTINTYANWELGFLNNILALGGRDPNSEKSIGGRWKITGEAIVVNKGINTANKEEDIALEEDIASE